MHNYIYILILSKYSDSYHSFLTLKKREINTDELYLILNR